MTGKPTPGKVDDQKHKWFKGTLPSFVVWGVTGTVGVVTSLIGVPDSLTGWIQAAADGTAAMGQAGYEHHERVKHAHEKGQSEPGAEKTKVAVTLIEGVLPDAAGLFGDHLKHHAEMPEVPDSETPESNSKSRVWRGGVNAVFAWGVAAAPKVALTIAGAHLIPFVVVGVSAQLASVAVLGHLTHEFNKEGEHKEGEHKEGDSWVRETFNSVLASGFTSAAWAATDVALGGVPGGGVVAEALKRTLLSRPVIEMVGTGASILARAWLNRHDKSETETDHAAESAVAIQRTPPTEPTVRATDAAGVKSAPEGAKTEPQTGTQPEPAPKMEPEARDPEETAVPEAVEPRPAPVETEAELDPETKSEPAAQPEHPEAVRSQSEPEPQSELDARTELGSDAPQHEATAKTESHAEAAQPESQARTESQAEAAQPESESKTEPQPESTEPQTEVEAPGAAPIIALADVEAAGIDAAVVPEIEEMMFGPTDAGAEPEAEDSALEGEVPEARGQAMSGPEPRAETRPTPEDVDQMVFDRPRAEIAGQQSEPTGVKEPEGDMGKDQQLEAEDAQMQSAEQRVLDRSGGD